MILSLSKNSNANWESGILADINIHDVIFFPCIQQLKYQTSMLDYRINEQSKTEKEYLKIFTEKTS